MRNLEWKKENEITLQAITILSLLANDIKNSIDQLGSLSVMTFGPIIASTGLTEDEVIGPKDLSIRTGSNTIHGARFKVHENSPGNIPCTGGLIVIHIDPLKLKIRRAVSCVSSGRVDTMLVADNFPEFGANLVAALASLNVQDLSHYCDFRLRS